MDLRFPELALARETGSDSQPRDTAGGDGAFAALLQRPAPEEPTAPARPRLDSDRDDAPPATERPAGAPAAPEPAGSGAALLIAQSAPAVAAPVAATSGESAEPLFILPPTASARAAAATALHRTPSPNAATPTPAAPGADGRTLLVPNPTPAAERRQPAEAATSAPIPPASPSPGMLAHGTPTPNRPAAASQPAAGVAPASTRAAPASAQLPDGAAPQAFAARDGHAPATPAQPPAAPASQSAALATPGGQVEAVAAGARGPIVPVAPRTTTKAGDPITAAMPALPSEPGVPPDAAPATAPRPGLAESRVPTGRMHPVSGGDTLIAAQAAAQQTAAPALAPAAPAGGDRGGTMPAGPAAPDPIGDMSGAGGAPTKGDAAAADMSAPARAEIAVDTTAPLARSARAAAAPLVAHVAVHVAQAAGDGSDRISLKLSPAELGRIDVKLEFGPEGRIHAVFAADRPHTLELLQRDARELARALQDAGLQADSGSLSFNLRDGRGQGFARAHDAPGFGPADPDVDADPVLPPPPIHAGIRTDNGRIDIRV